MHDDPTGADRLDRIAAFLGRGDFAKTLRAEAERRIESEARLFDGDTLCATATMRAVATEQTRTMWRSACWRRFSSL